MIVQYVPASRWARGALPARGFFVEARITSGTNSPDDKARYVAGYVAVSESAADAWGHDGETQAGRYLKDSVVA